MKEFMACLAIVCFFNLPVWAQNNLRCADIRTLGTGGSTAISSVLFNPASLSLSTNQFIDIDYFNKYRLKELSTVSVVYGNSCLPLPFGLHISSFGYQKYRETLFRLVFSKNLSSQWILGISVQYALLQTELYEEDINKVSTDVGILFIPDENLLIGLSITDLPSVMLNNKKTDIKDFNYYSVRGSFQYQFMNNLLIALSVTYFDRSVLSFNAGIEYAAYEHFFVRTGVQTHPLSPAFGVGVKVASFRLDIAANYQTPLGVSSGVGLSYVF